MPRLMLSSVEYAELAGLHIALANLQTSSSPNAQAAVIWMRERIAELESRKH
jgi:hypothetical protein